VKVLSVLNELQARIYVADRALDLGRGGISRLSELTGMSRTTITKATLSDPSIEVSQLSRGMWEDLISVIH
jgi:hypothetical protein